jgi:spermidine/putrescine-binding protein
VTRHQGACRKYDPGNEYSINYMWGTTGLGVNVDMVKERLGEDAELNTWDLIFDPEHGQACRLRHLHARRADRNDPGGLNYLGIDPDSQGSGVIDKAKDVLSAVRPTSASSTPRNTSTRWPMATSALPWAGRATSCRRATALPRPTMASPSNTSSRRKAR